MLTQLLAEWRAGDRKALESLTPLVYSELRKLAGGYMYAERAGHTLQPTALVNEAYVRLIESNIDWRDRAHFFAVAARLMRRILIDCARARASQKRGNNARRVPLTDVQLATEDRGVDLFALDAALDKLEQFDQRKSDLLALHYFAGLSLREIAEVTDTPKTNLVRELTLARSWLYDELQ